MRTIQLNRQDKCEAIEPQRHRGLRERWAYREWCKTFRVSGLFEMASTGAKEDVGFAEDNQIAITQDMAFFVDDHIIDHSAVGAA